MDYSWQDKGLCRGMDPEIFFVNPGESAAEAKAICVECPVRTQCLEWAIDIRQRFGVFGGLTARERENVIRGKTDKVVHECLCCGTRFMPLNRNQKYCTESCRLRSRPVPRPKQPKPLLEHIKTHGHSGYSRGCRCPVCTVGHTETLKAYRARRKAS